MEDLRNEFVKDGLYGASFVELRLNDEVFPTSAVELRRRVDIGDGGGIPELVYRELEDVKGDVRPDRTLLTSANSGSLSKLMLLRSIIELNLSNLLQIDDQI